MHVVFHSQRISYVKFVESSVDVSPDAGSSVPRRPEGLRSEKRGTCERIVWNEDSVLSEDSSLRKKIGFDQTRSDEAEPNRRLSTMLTKKHVKTLYEKNDKE